MRLPLIVTVGLLLMVGCKTVEPPVVEVLPVLIYQVPFPPLPPTVNASYLRLELKLLVNKDGEVERAFWLRGSGFDEWDSSALAAVNQWKYAPARHQSTPVSLWVRQVVKVQVREPLYMWLAEIVSPDMATSDSIVSLLREGKDFEALARELSTSETAERGGMMGRLDIRTFPLAVQDELVKLRRGEITKSIRLGDRYVIFKRVGEGWSRTNEIRSL